MKLSLKKIFADVRAQIDDLERNGDVGKLDHDTTAVFRREETQPDGTRVVTTVTVTMAVYRSPS